MSQVNKKNADQHRRETSQYHHGDRVWLATKDFRSVVGVEPVNSKYIDLHKILRQINKPELPQHCTFVPHIMPQTSHAWTTAHCPLCQGNTAVERNCFPDHTTSYKYSHQIRTALTNTRRLLFTHTWTKSIPHTLCNYFSSTLTL